MLCPQCNNYLTSIAAAGEAVRKCSTCDYQHKEPDLVVYATRIGVVPTHETSEAIADSTPKVSEEMARYAAELATDPTLYSPPNFFCPKCGSDTKVDLGRNKMYTFICPECKIVVVPVSKPPGAKGKKVDEKSEK